QVVLELLRGVLLGRAIRIVELGPAGEAGPHAMAQLVVADLLRQLGDELRPLRARTDQAHVAAQHVPQLRQLVDAGLADEAAHARDACVLLAGPDRHAVLLRVRAHAAELDQAERAAAFADALLAVQ